jgi:hypothetical protein
VPSRHGKKTVFRKPIYTKSEKNYNSIGKKYGYK